MPELYNIRASTGCGYGVFAKKAIPAGTTVMTEAAAIIIHKDPPKITETDVQRAFDELSNDKKERFLQLHESHRPYKSQVFRIYKGNAFGDHGCGKLFLEISRLNHSCLPNAEMTGPAECPSIIAVKSINEGEEIFISYNPGFDGMSCQQRAGALKVYYGFTCNCSACNLAPEAQHLSDWRRALMHVLSSKLQGKEPPDLRMMEALATMTPAQAEAPEILDGVDTFPLRRPLTVSQSIAYSFLYARLLEAESLHGHQAALCYGKAAALLATQMSWDQDMCILPSVRIVMAWQEKALTGTENTRGKGSTEYKLLERLSSSMLESDVVGSGILFVSSLQHDILLLI